MRGHWCGPAPPGPVDSYMQHGILRHWDGSGPPGPSDSFFSRSNVEREMEAITAARSQDQPPCRGHWGGSAPPGPSDSFFSRSNVEREIEASAAARSQDPAHYRGRSSCRSRGHMSTSGSSRGWPFTYFPPDPDDRPGEHAPRRHPRSSPAHSVPASERAPDFLPEDNQVYSPRPQSESGGMVEFFTSRPPNRVREWPEPWDSYPPWLYSRCFTSRAGSLNDVYVQNKLFMFIF